MFLEFTPKFIEAFWLRVDKNGPIPSHNPELGNCWNWIAKAKHFFGYGILGYQRKYYRSHQISYLLCKGEIPEGKVIRHLCHNPACCNPEHLAIGTQKENIQDTVKAGRTAKGKRNARYTHPETTARGERNAWSKLTEKQVFLIHHLFSVEKKDTKELALQFNTSRTNVYRVLSGKAWAHLHPANRDKERVEITKDQTELDL